nr:DUF721 domain-containing protein [uncultured Capnocytophaga sp.]
MKRYNDRDRIGDDASLGDIIALIISKYHLRRGLQKAAVPSLWEELMGTAIAKYTASVELNGSTLYVRLTSAALSNELSMGKTKIINLMNEGLEEKLIHKLIFLS